VQARPDKTEKTNLYSKINGRSAQGPPALAIVASQMDVVELEINDSIELAAAD
jgi:hypothetical protein